MNITDVRAKFPQYDDLTDDQLASALHRRFYADMSAEDFRAKIGLSPAAATSSGPTTMEMAPTPKPPTNRPAPQSPVDAIANLMGSSNPAPSAAVPPRARPPMQGPMPPPQPVPANGQISDLMRAAETQSPGYWSDYRKQVPMGPVAPRQAAAPEPQETIAELMTRRGQEVAQGAAGVLTSVARARGIDDKTLFDAIQADAPNRVKEAARQVQSFERILARGVSDDGVSPMTPQEIETYQKRLADASEAVTNWADVAEFGPHMVGNRTKSMERAASDLQSWTDETFGKPPKDDSLWSDLAYGTGSMIGFMLPSVVAGPAGIVVTAQMGADSAKVEAYDRAIQKGASERDAQTAAAIAGFLGTAEAAPIAAALHRIPEPLRRNVMGRLGRFFSQAAKSSVEEAVQEGGMAIAQNLIAKGIYDPNQQVLTKDVGYQAIVGGLLGGLVGGGTNAFGRGPSEQPSAVVNRKPEEPKPDGAAAQPEPDAMTQIAAAMSAPKPQTAPAAPAPTTPAAPVPAAQPISRADAEANPDRYEIMPETEGRGDTWRQTGREVAYDRETGKVVPVEDARGDGTTAVQPERPPEPTPEPPAQAQPESEARPGQPDNFEFLTGDQVKAIEAEPDVMQYKAGSDAEGVTDRLKGVTEWRPERAGVSIVYEYENGRRVVADGHQRLGLAKRLIDEGKPVQMPVMVLRQADGITPEEARATAALKNIAEGSGTAVDAAKVLRDTDQTIDQLGLPPQSALVRDAEGLRRLSGDAFGMVVNGVASERDGAIVGRVVQDEAAQSNILALLTRLKPKNAFQAEQIARDAASATVESEQDSLFGPEADTQNLYVERAEILDGALRQVKDRARVFRTLVDKADTASAAGNVLNKSGNQQELDTMARVRDYLQRESNTKGPISDALTAAAKDLNAGGKRADSVRAFLDAIEGQLEPGGRDGKAGDEGSRPADQQRQPEPEPQAVTPDQADKTDAETIADLMRGPTVEKTDAGQQTVVPGAEKSDAQAAQSMTDRQKAEMEVRKNQSKMRKPGGNSGDEGPLFGGQGDLLDITPAPNAKPEKGKGIATTPEALAARRAEILTDFPESDWIEDKAPNALKVAKADVQDLMQAIAAAETIDGRHEAARKWTVAMGKKSNREHLVLFHKDGTPIGISRGREGSPAKGYSVSPEPHVFAYIMRNHAEAGVVAIHNHPGNTGLSAADVGFLMHSIVDIRAHGHAGSTSIGTPGPAMPTIDGTKNAGVVKVNKIVVAFNRISDATHQSVGYPIFYRLDPTKGREVAATEAHRASRAAFNLLLDRLGVITYKGDADAILEEFGVDFDAFYDQHYDAAARDLRRLGFNIAADGDRGGNGAGRKPASQQGGGTSESGKTRKPSGTSGNGQEKSGNDDFDAALDALFGKDENDVPGTGGDLEPDRRDADTADAMGGTDVPATGGRSGSGSSKRGKAGRRTTRKRADNGGLPDGDAAPVGAGGDQGAPGTDGAEPGTAGGRDGGRGDAGRDGGLPVDDGTAGGPAAGADGAANLDATDAAKIADLFKDPGIAAFYENALGIDPQKYDALKEIFDRRMQGKDLTAPRKTLFVDMMRPLIAQGVTRDQMVKLEPYFTHYLDQVAADRAKPEKPAQKPIEAKDRAEVQAKADKVPVKLADAENIDATLPLLLPEQRGDVLKVEKRFAKPDGHGMMLTNGTGTGKTFSGGGVIKRFVRQGKGNILVVAPSDAVIEGWLGALDALGVKASKLKDTTDAGQGVVVTTYANVEQNAALANREWDLIVPDEAHNLSANAAGEPTGALRTVRAITHRSEADMRHKSRLIHAKEWKKLHDAKDGPDKTAQYRKLREREDAEVAAWSKKPRGKVLFLSATPFAYDKSIDYAEGYLFNYPADGRIGNSNQSGRNAFMVQNFGYRIRYHKLTRPEAAVDNAVFEREFHQRLVREGVLSGRSLQVDVDYDRRFVATADSVGTKIDAILDDISKGSRSDSKKLQRGYMLIEKEIRKSFDYLKRQQLLEAIKARAAVPDIEKHLALGRKVVVFHDFNVGGGTNPFSAIYTLEGDEVEAAALDLIGKHPDIYDLDFSGYRPPAEALSTAFGKRARLFSGRVPKSKRLKNLADFNTDNSGVDVLIVQADAGGAGISMHDTTGQHQRVLINLGMPTKPTTTLQQEGRILRVGTQTNAPFRYYTIGTGWERYAFAKRIAERSGTVENLALGNQARAITQGFIDAYENAEALEPSDADGTGGREKDRAENVTTPFERAKTHYFGRAKMKGRRDQREGLDFYPTPEPLALKMVEWAGIRPGDSVLEPSAGDGSIARYMPDSIDLTMVEPSQDLASRALLRAPQGKAVESTFEGYHIVNKHDVIVMNPPFGSGGKTAFEHVEKAMRHVKPGGRIVALVPTGPAADKRWDALPTGDFAVSTIMLPDSTFERAGTKVMSRVLILDRVPNGMDGKPDRSAQARQDSESRYTDVRSAKSITDLFDRIEGMQMPQRFEPTEQVEPEDARTPPPGRTPSAPVGEGVTFKTGETVHAKTGDDLYVATANERVEREVFNQMRAVAKSHGGYWSSYKARGAIPGFQFKSAADRQAFLDDMAKPTLGGAEEPGTPAFKAWFGDSKVVDENGDPLVVYHGTRDDFESFQDFSGGEDGFYFSSNPEVSAEYAGPAGGRPDEADGQVMPVYLSLKNPLIVDWGSEIRQAERRGVRVKSATMFNEQVFNDLLGRAEFEGRDGLIVNDIMDGWDDGSQVGTTYVAFSPEQIKSVYNRGTFDPADPRILYQSQPVQEAAAATEEIARIMPRLRAKLDALNLKRVRLHSDLGAGWQGQFKVTGDGKMDIVIGASLDPEKTLHHEVIHALRSMNLFTDAEWAALTAAAQKGWIEKHDIAKRYPDLTAAEQIEEAIAEEFAEAVASKRAPKGGALVRAFNKIARLFKAIREVFSAEGYDTTESIFGRVLSGEIGAREAGNTGRAVKLQRAAAVRPLTAQGRAHRNTGMSGPLFLPDRRMWETLTDASKPIWQRLRDLPAAAGDTVDRARGVIQDRFLPVRRAQEVIERATGRPLPLDHDAYVAETTFSGKVGRHLFDIDEKFTKPIIQIIAKSDGRMTSDTVGQWLYARHAIERNKYIASINPDMQDGGSGMLDAEARAILSAVAADPDAASYQEIGRLVDEMREFGLKMREDAGLITQADADMWRNQYKHYVPLKGFEETDHAEATLDIGGIGRRFSTRGPESRRAMGRQSEAFNPLQAALTQAQEVAIRSEKNLVGQTLYRLVKDNPSKALWEVKKPKQKRYFNRTTGLVETRTENPVTMVLEPNEMAVKVGGEEVRILFKDERIARAAGTIGADQMHGAIRVLSMFSRFFSMTRTMLNPEFMITNAFRDFQTAHFNVQGFSKDRARIARAMTKNWRKAFAGIMRGQRGKFDTEWAKYFDEFQKAGAQVWFWTMENPEVARGELDKRIDLARGNKAQRLLKHMTRPSAIFNMRDNAILSFIERTNLAVDNAIRLSAFVEARRAGWPVERAAFMAKELTVNFNRRGDAGAELNAFYPFFNAAVQGGIRTAKALASKRVAKMVLFAFGIGALNDLVNAALSEEDDDGELFYDKIPNWRSERNFHLVGWGTGENSASIPMPYGYNIFPYAGQQLGKVIRGVKDADEAFADTVTALFAAFSPITGGSPMTTAAPFFADPFMEMAENENFAGTPIYPREFNDFEPDAYRHFASASEASKMVAQSLNDITGGDFREPGAIDVSPETLDHLSGFVGGSAAAFWGRTSDVVAKAIKGDFENIEQYKVPFLRNVSTRVGDWTDRERFYRFRAEVQDARADKKAYTDAGLPVPDRVKTLDALYEDVLKADRERRGQGEWRQSKEDALAPREDDAIFMEFNKKFLKAMGSQAE